MEEFPESFDSSASSIYHRTQHSRTREPLTLDHSFSDISVPRVCEIASCSCFDTKWDIVASDLGFTNDRIEKFRARAQALYMSPGVAMLKLWGSQAGATIRVIRGLLTKYDMEQSLRHLDIAMKEEFRLLCLYVSEDHYCFSVDTIPGVSLKFALTNFLKEKKIESTDCLDILEPKVHWDSKCEELKGLQLTFRNNSSVSSTKNGAFIPSTTPPSMPASSDSEHVFICTNDNHTLYTVINDEDWTRESSIQGDTESVSSVSSTLESIYTTPMFEIPTGALNIQLPKKKLSHEQIEDACQMQQHHNTTYNNTEVFEILQHCRGNGYFITWVHDDKKAFVISITYLRKLRHYKIRNTDEGLVLIEDIVKFRTLTELVQHYMENKVVLPLRGRRLERNDNGELPDKPPGGFLMLQHPVPKAL